ncbi:MAG: GspH/FimT family protein [Acidobacteria bacterium]|nr:GspH/FimT family protein [Acidobacteriota bacterium]
MVLILLSVVGALSLPALQRGFPSILLRAAVLDVQNAARHARNQAVIRQKVYVLTLDRERGAVILEDEDGKERKSFSLREGIRIASVKVEGREAGAVASLYFYPNGSATESLVTVEGSQGRKLEVQVESMTGLAYIRSLKAT